MSTPSHGTMYKHRKITLERLEKWVSEEFFTSVNFNQSRFYDKLSPLNHVRVTSFGRDARPLFDQVMQERGPSENWNETRIGESFGPAWSTHWFRLDAQIPTEWLGREVHLLWDSNSEACVFSQDGMPLQGLTGGRGFDQRHAFAYSSSLKEQELNLVLYIEMAVNGMFGCGNDGLINPPDENKTCKLQRAELGLFNSEAFGLYYDFVVISEMAKHLDENSQRGNEALYTANEMINLTDPKRPETFTRARQLAAKFFASKNPPCEHQIFACGHSHLDTCWLWKYAESQRKVYRTVSSQLGLMDRYENLTYCQSAALHYEYLKTSYPKLYEKVKQKVKEGRWFPVGGSWVECCGVLPGGENFCRQFLYGQRFFKQEFGKYCDTFFLPDSFGYSAAFPQILLQSQIKYFVTQKLSWNLINKFPHHSFWWTGLDGSNMLTHFPPADTYCNEVKVEQLLFEVSNFKDKDRSNVSLMLHGFGDGGGGPSPSHCERLKRAENTYGLPSTKSSSITEFFESIDGSKLLSWTGELYLELHRGCYTSQALAKRGNRKSELLLRNAELFSVIAHNDSYTYPHEEFERLWKIVAVNSFHDALPGTSLEICYKDDIYPLYKQVDQSGKDVLSKALSSLTSPSTPTNVVVFNSLSWNRQEVVAIPLNDMEGVQCVQRSHKDEVLALVKCPPLGYKHHTETEWNRFDGRSTLATAKLENDVTILENEFVRVEISTKSALLNVIDKASSRTIVEGGNLFRLHTNRPLFWDAWDVEVYDLEQYYDLPLTQSDVTVKIVENGPLRVAVKVKLDISKTSHLEQVITLPFNSRRIDFETRVSWVAEDRVWLKVLFPSRIHTKRATYDIQFGNIERPTHKNTSWDLAQFEVHAHKYACISEYNAGVALMSDCKYGYSCHEDHKTGLNTMSLSLLRAPKAPDEHCDDSRFVGVHEFTYSLYPYQGNSTFQDAHVIQQAYQLNVPIEFKTSAKSCVTSYSFCQVSHDACIIETIKLSEDEDNDVIIRLYEAYGAHHESIDLNFCCGVKNVSLCDILEEPVEEYNSPHQDTRVGTVGQKSVQLRRLHPFEIVNLRVTFENTQSE